MPTISRRHLSHALRTLRRTPWYAVSAIGVLAISLSLHTAVFAFVDGTLFKPLAYADDSTLFAVTLGYSRLAEPYRVLPPIADADFVEWRAAVPGAAITAFYPNGSQQIGVQDDVRSAGIDSAFFDVLGVRPVIGGFTAADFQAASLVRPAIVTDGFWRRRLGAAPNAIGRTLIGADGSGIRVVGVLSPDFLFPFPEGPDFLPEILVPRVSQRPPSRGRSLSVLVRSPPESAPAMAGALNAVVTQQAGGRPILPAPPGLSARTGIIRAGYDRAGLIPIRDALTESSRDYAWAAFAGATALVLLACLNVAGLCAARVRDRRRELALRRALGARVSDLVILLAAEHVVVVGAGATLALIGARLILGGVAPLMRGVMVVLKAPAIDARVFLCALLAAGACGALVTLLSVRSVTRADVRAPIHDGGGTTLRVRRTFSILSLELAIGMVLAVGGALIVGSVLRAWTQDPGFDPSHRAIVQVSAAHGVSGEAIEGLITDIERLPGVEHAGAIAHPFLEHAFNGSEFDRPAGVPPNEVGVFPIESAPITHGFFDAAGIKATDGRLPTDAELATGAPVIVVTENVARTYWLGRRAVGQTLTRNNRPYDVVGVVANLRLMSLDLEPQGEIYWPNAASDRPGLGSIVIHLSREAALGAVVKSLAQGCVGCRVWSAEMASDALGDSIRSRRLNAWLFAGFGAVALAIIGAGVLGLVAMNTNRRTREIGVRMALGATRSGVVRQIVGEQIRPVAAGLALGGVAAAWATRFVASYLYKTPVYDVAAWTGAIAAIVAVALVAALVPSQRASRIDPVRALRSD